MVWEIFTRARNPGEIYSLSVDSKMTRLQMLNLLLKGARLPFPESCPKGVEALIGKCWETEPDKRPHSEAIVEELLKIGENNNLMEITTSTILKLQPTANYS